MQRWKLRGADPHDCISCDCLAELTPDDQGQWVRQEAPQLLAKHNPFIAKHGPHNKPT